MEQKALDLITEKVGQALAPQGFQKSDAELNEEGGLYSVFLGDGTVYCVYFDADKNRFELRSGSVDEEEKLKEDWKVISMWLFDPENDTLKEAESIGNDFVETIEGPKRIAAVNNKKKKRSKDAENSPDPVFFYNRLVNFMPELKEEMNEERVRYGDVRAVTFAKEKVLPRLNAIASRKNDGETVKKLAQLLSDIYKNGEMDTRAIITMVLLNGMESQAIENLRPDFGEELEKAYKAGLKFKGKTVKPEKQKKQKKFVADSLNSR